MDQQWIISSNEAGERLDVFLSKQLSERTRSSIAKALKQGAGIINDKTASVHQFLKAGDVVKFKEETAGARTLRLSLSKTMRPVGRRSEHEQLPKLSILEETPDWIVIDKPAGILVHPDAVTQEGTLVDALVAHAPEIAKVGEDPSRPGIVHRLDKDVGGLMVIAKTQNAFDHLKRQFAEHSVDKEYLALVHGELPHDEGDIKFRIARSKSKARMAARPEHEKEGKAAWTHYRVLERFHGATLCALKILSGRTHQIRAHLHGLGFPIIGDTLYTRRQTDRKIPSSPLLLQAVQLSFIDPVTEERKTFTLAANPAFAELIKTFKSHVQTEK